MRCTFFHGRHHNSCFCKCETLMPICRSARHTKLSARPKVRLLATKRFWVRPLALTLCVHRGDGCLGNWQMDVRRALLYGQGFVQVKLLFKGVFEAGQIFVYTRRGRICIDTCTPLYIHIRAHAPACESTWGELEREEHICKCMQRLFLMGQNSSHREHWPAKSIKCECECPRVHSTRSTAGRDYNSQFAPRDAVRPQNLAGPPCMAGNPFYTHIASWDMRPAAGGGGRARSWIKTPQRVCSWKGINLVLSRRQCSSAFAGSPEIIYAAGASANGCCCCRTTRVNYFACLRRAPREIDFQKDNAWKIVLLYWIKYYTCLALFNVQIIN